MVSREASTQSNASKGSNKAEIKHADAILYHMTERDGKEVFVARIVLCRNKPVLIGRSAACTYVLNESVVSGQHCRLHVCAFVVHGSTDYGSYFLILRRVFHSLPSGSGGVIVSCSDISSNGTILNGHKIKKSSMLVIDGDILQIPDLTNHKFVCHHIVQDPNPSQPLIPGLRGVYRNIGAFILTTHCLGSGSYATVHLAFEPSANRQVACKTIKIKRETDPTNLMKEVRMLETLNHPNINRIIGREKIGKSLHIFLQLCTAGDLFTYITTQPQCHLVEGEAKYILYQPENLLLHTPGPYPHIQIADFGLARPRSYQETLNVAGTVSYLPPEGILALDNKYMGYLGMPSDCWSCGIILFIMLCGRHPFDEGPSHEASEDWIEGSIGRSRSRQEDHNDEEDNLCPQMSLNTEERIKQRIVAGTLDFREEEWETMTEAKNLVSSLLSPDPQKRGTVDEALQHPWLSQESEELEYEYRTSILRHGRRGSRRPRAST